jgi:membrane-bound lytic murein transglycosylase A
MICLSISGCTTLDKKIEKIPPQLTGVTYQDIEGWQDDNQQETLLAFQKSCSKFLKLSPDKETGFNTKAALWQKACQNLPDSKNSSTEDARQYFEAYFNPFKVTSGTEDTGLFTGYYEASLRGSPMQTGIYQTPLRARPGDLVMVNLGEFVPDLKGQRIAGRVNNGQLKPYEDRAMIETGKLPKDMDKPLYWVDSAVDAFFLQVQGSGVVTLPDGQAVRVGYDGQNGHPYTAIGKELIARGALTKENVSMQSIRDWLAANPNEASDVMRTNKSYVFFRKLPSDLPGPIGALGVSIEAERSVAIDPKFIPLGAPIFLSTTQPNTNEPLDRLMIAQDTGGAIRGGVRADFYWGTGDAAGRKAGSMKQQGKIWALLPKDYVFPIATQEFAMKRNRIEEASK